MEAADPGGGEASSRVPSKPGSVWLWLVGVVLALVVVGPGLAPGSLLNLDLVLTPHLPVPSGVWGLGPGLPRTVPFGVPMAWVSTVVGGPVTGKLIIVGSITIAFVGSARLVRTSSLLTQAGAGALYALSPFLLTRVGVGHLTFMVATALLPFALPTLLQPSRRVESTFLWSAAFGFVGFAGALLAAPVVAVGLVADRGRRWLLVVGGFAVAQLPWIVPGLFVTGQGLHLAGASNFATDARGLGGYARVLGGFGFWDRGQQVSLRLGGAAAVLSVLVFAFAVMGARDLPREWGRRATVLAAIGLVVALGSRAPVLRLGYEAVVSTLAGEAIRESQRLLPLYLVWLAPAAALGALRLARAAPESLSSVAAALPLAVALVLAGPGLFGLNGRLEPASFPAEWARARTAREDAGGTLLALPFSEYVDLSFAGNRRVFNPIPSYFGGDVIFSSDPELDASAQERADPRERTARRIVRTMVEGEHPSKRLAALGVRWVALLHEENWRDFDALRRDPGLRRVEGGGSLELFKVLAWRGPAVGHDASRVDVDTPILPVARAGSDGSLTWFRAGSDGWLRGFTPVEVRSDGVLKVLPGSGPLWYWPAAVVLAADVVTGTVVILALRRRRARPVSDGTKTNCLYQQTEMRRVSGGSGGLEH